VARRAVGGRIGVGDIARFQGWDELLRGVDIVIHLAARAHVTKEEERDPLARFREVNVQATRSLALAARAAEVRRFIFLSSIGVNGVASTAPFVETDTPNPTEPYAISKWEAEQLLLELSRDSGMSVTRIRPPLVVGPGAKGNLLRLMRLASSRLPIPLGSLRNKRTFIALDDLCALLVLCVTHERAPGELFLAGDPESLSTPELISEISQALGHTARIVSIPEPLLRLAARAFRIEAQVERLSSSLLVNADRAGRLLGWHAKAGIRSAVHAMAAAYAAEQHSTEFPEDRSRDG
jgi:nucleoside-diphosphate-sugar epimerase